MTADFGCPVALPEASQVSYRCQSDGDCLRGQTCQANQCATIAIDAAVAADASVGDQSGGESGRDASRSDRAGVDGAGDGAARDRAEHDVIAADRGQADSGADGATTDRSTTGGAATDRASVDAVTVDSSVADAVTVDRSVADTMTVDSTLPPCPGARPGAVCDPADSTLVACYTFDADSDRVGGVVDSSQYHNDGTPTAVSYVAHGNGQALSLAGTGYVSVADSASLDATSALTITACSSTRTAITVSPARR